jgi:hypothetical protein
MFLAGGPWLSIIHSFYRHRECQWVFREFRPSLSCVKQFVAAGSEDSSRFGVVPRFSPISLLHDLLRTTDHDGFRS